MIQLNEFTQWFGKEVKNRWPKHHFEWTELGDWHWRLGDLNLDTLTEAVRRHKACDDWRVPSLKKVHDYACRIKAASTPKRSDDAGVWEIFTNTTYAEMLERRIKLYSTGSPDMNELSKRNKKTEPQQ